MANALASGVGGAGQMVEGTDYSIGEIVEKITVPNGTPPLTFDLLEGWDVKNITNGRAFLSKILQLTLKWKRVDVEPKSVILKVPTTESFATILEDAKDSGSAKQADAKAEAQEWDAEGNIAFITLVHSREVKFYHLFSTLSTPDIPHLKLPKFHFSHDYLPSHRRGVIMMEDMCPWASPIPMLPGLSNGQVESAIKEMAKVHSLSWIEKGKWVEQLPNRPRDGKFLELMKGMTMRLVEMKPEMFTEIISKLLPYFNEDSFHTAVYSEDKYGFSPSIVHGDLWAPNLLWRHANNRGEVGSSTEVAAIIDWQMVHLGNPLEDLARLLSLNVSAKYRRENTHRLLALYLAEVKQYTGGGNYGQPREIEQVREAYRYACLYIALHSGFGAVMYYTMPSVVGEKGSPEREGNQQELLDRMRSFYEDTYEALLAP